MLTTSLSTIWDGFLQYKLTASPKKESLPHLLMKLDQIPSGAIFYI